MSDSLAITEEALERLTVWLQTPAGRPTLASLRPPASDVELNRLRAVIAPYELPREVLALLRWHNGQSEHPDPPTLMPIDDGGPLLGTEAMAEAYLLLRDRMEPWQWNPLWLPLLQHRWTQLAVEIAPESVGVIVENNFGDMALQIRSSSLAAFLQATARIAEAGLLDGDPDLWRESIRQEADRFGWEHWPHDRKLPDDERGANWPERWRVARGFND